MLRNLSIQNFAIVDRVDLEFEPGFNVLTGETGAGKSLLVDALYFLLGDKLDPGVLRTGEEKAVAEALFQVEGTSPAAAKMAEWGLDVSKGEILVRREYQRSSGKTRSFVNGSLSTAAMVSELADLLVDLHGQHEHQAIFRVSRHRSLVDSFGRLERLAAKTAEFSRALSRLLEERNRLGDDPREAALRRDLLAFQVNELSSARLEEMDEEKLMRDYQAQKHAGKIREALAAAQEALDQGPSGGASGLAGAARSNVADAAKLDPGLSGLAALAAQAQENINQLSYDLARSLDSEAYSENRLQELSDRVDLLHSLKRKYGKTLPEVRSALDRCRAELNDLEHREERLREIQKGIEAAAEAYRVSASDLHEKRVKAGAALASKSKGLLEDLGLSDAQLEVLVEAQENPESPVRHEGKNLLAAPDGWDRVEFQFSGNPGEPLRPLTKVASGGEASRILLALKAVLSDSDDVGTLVFDEIDTGVGARTAPAVGRVMGQLSEKKQILCISHLAPLAGLGRCHYQVRKQVKEGKTFTLTARLEGEERVEELAKMLGGERVSEASLRHAREMLKASGRSGI